MDSLFLLQFACFMFMLINAIFVALSHLYVRWVNKRYERSRWMVVFAMIGLAIQYVVQMAFGFRAADDILGAVVNILIYTPELLGIQPVLKPLAKLELFMNCSDS